MKSNISIVFVLWFMVWVSYLRILRLAPGHEDSDTGWEWWGRLRLEPGCRSSHFSGSGISPLLLAVCGATRLNCVMKTQAEVQVIEGITPKNRL